MSAPERLAYFNCASVRVVPLRSALVRRALHRCAPSPMRYPLTCDQPDVLLRAESNQGFELAPEIIAQAGGGNELPSSATVTGIEALSNYMIN